jgi:thiol-disulfide isomerase/thioredoxin
MNMRLFAALVVTSSTAIAIAQTPAPAAQPVSQTPAECLKAVRDHAARRQKELQPLTREGVMAITQERTAMAKTCAARFDVAAVAETDLSALIDLYTEAGLPDLANAAVARAIASKTLGETDRATVLVQAIRAGMRAPKSAERNAGLDRMSDAVLAQKLSAHQTMNGYYRADDIDAGIIRHSTWMIERARSFTPDERGQYGSGIVSAYVNMAEAWAGQGQNDDAIALLERAKTDWAALPRIAERIDPTLERYRLVGTRATTIAAPRWLNAANGAASMDMAGAVTLLEFTAHWCGPCKESYPGIKRLLAKYGPQGFRVVFATELYGYFETEGNLAPDVELERDRAYFKKEGMNVPIAVEERPVPKTVNGRPVYTPAPNSAAYKVGGIPQIHLIDRQGNIRLIMVGYDDANEPRLATLIEDLLKERTDYRVNFSR